MTIKPKFKNTAEANSAYERAQTIIAAVEAQMDTLRLKQQRDEQAFFDRLDRVVKELVAKRGLAAGERILHRAEKLLAGNFGKPANPGKANSNARPQRSGAQDSPKPAD